jgi:hypothetical protein
MPVVLLPGRTMTWGGLVLYRDSSSDYFRSKTAPFEWEVDASLDDDDEYEARVSFQGVKLAVGKGSARQTALMSALQNLEILVSAIGDEIAARREGRLARKKRTVRPT